jgi:hypothetical protein
MFQDKTEEICLGQYSTPSGLQSQKLINLKGFHTISHFTFSNLVFQYFTTLKGLNMNNRGSQPTDKNAYKVTTLKGLNIFSGKANNPHP